MGKATESSFNILKAKNVDDIQTQASQSISQLSRPQKKSLGDPYAQNAQDKAIKLFFESTEELNKFLQEQKTTGKKEPQSPQDFRSKFGMRAQSAD